MQAKRREQQPQQARPVAEQPMAAVLQATLREPLRMGEVAPQPVLQERVEGCFGGGATRHLQVGHGDPQDE